MSAHSVLYYYCYRVTTEIFWNKIFFFYITSETRLLKKSVEYWSCACPGSRASKSYDADRVSYGLRSVYCRVLPVSAGRAFLLCLPKENDRRKHGVSCPFCDDKTVSEFGSHSMPSAQYALVILHVRFWNGRKPVELINNTLNLPSRRHRRSLFETVRCSNHYRHNISRPYIASVLHRRR